MYSQIETNKRKTWLIMAGFLVVIAGLGYVFGHYLGSYVFTFIAVTVGLSYAAFSYFNADKMAIAINRARPITEKDNQRLWRTVENLSITMGLPMPRVYIIDDPAPNAFATGRDPNHAVVAVTTGLLEIMDDAELQGVLAHEMGHVQNYDIRVAMIAFALVTVVGVMADLFWRTRWYGGRRRGDGEGGGIVFFLVILVAILAPVIANLLRLAVSRKREYLADATGALTTRYPEGLASALEKIAQRGAALKRQNTATAHLFFANPLKGKAAKLFSTHPPIEERIAKLREMGSKL